MRWESLKDYHALYNHILENLSLMKKNYIFLDEIQIVPEFQKAINSLFLRDDVDIYITGSNAYLLSGELSTLLSGRYIELSILPLSFKEYWELVGGDKRRRLINIILMVAFLMLQLLITKKFAWNTLEVYSTLFYLRILLNARGFQT